MEASPAWVGLGPAVIAGAGERDRNGREPRPPARSLLSAAVEEVSCVLSALYRVWSARLAAVCEAEWRLGAGRMNG